MNLLILEPKEREGKYFHLTKRKYEHIIKVWKAKIGDTLHAGFLNESYGLVEILGFTTEGVLVEYRPLVSKQNYNPNVYLFSSFQRPQTTKKILQLSASCGLKKIFFFPFDKSEKSYENSSLWKEKNYEQELILGLEQGKKVEIPEVIWSFEVKEKISFSFPNVTFILDLEGNDIFSYKELLTQELTEVGIILGPERGLTDKDKKFFLDQGAYPLRLSKNTLRSEFALAFALSQLELVLGVQR